MITVIKNFFKNSMLNLYYIIVPSNILVVPALYRKLLLRVPVQLPTAVQTPAVLLYGEQIM